MTPHNIIETISILIILSTFFINRWKKLDNVSQCVRRSFFILLSMSCIYVAISASYESIEQLESQTFTFYFIRRILVAVGWWIIYWSIVFRQLNVAKRLWK